MFADRRDAGRQLADRLVPYAGLRPIVIAMPRGGVPVAAEVAERLGAPLDIIVVRKIGCPWQPELGIGAIAEGTAGRSRLPNVMGRQNRSSRTAQ